MNKTTTIAIVIALIVIGWLVFKPNMSPVPQTNEPEIVAENPEGEADPSRMTLGMTTWKWITSTEGGKEVKPIKADAFTVKFNDDGKFAVTTDCNQMGGSFVADKTNITFSNMFSTKMFCEGSQETIFSTLLSDARTYVFTSRGELILTTKTGGTVVLR
jgi:heat shock protein HslJ